MAPDSHFPEPDYDALRLHLTRLRHDRGWSYNELAARAGIGRSTLVYLESGATNRNQSRSATTGTIGTWYKIARALEMDLGDLLRPLNGQPDS